jgi:membrane protein implicated in regulation of membrane protease activity
MSLGAGIFLIAAGAVLRFAIATTSTHGLNIHVVGVILMLAGAIGLLLSLLAGGWLNRRRNPAATYNPAPAYGRRARTLVRRRTVYQDDVAVPAGQVAYQDEPPLVGQPLYRDEPPA